jgi:hypothetical protein
MPCIAQVCQAAYPVIITPAARSRTSMQRSLCTSAEEHSIIGAT